MSVSPATMKTLPGPVLSVVTRWSSSQTAAATSMAILRFADPASLWVTPNRQLDARLKWSSIQWHGTVVRASFGSNVFSNLCRSLNCDSWRISVVNLLNIVPLRSRSVDQISYSELTQTKWKWKVLIFRVVGWWLGSRTVGSNDRF